MGPLVRDRKVLTLLVEMRCNSYCVFCGNREVDEALLKSRRRLGLSVPKTTFGDVHARYTLATATEALERGRAEGYEVLSLQGGEPTLFPDIVPLVANARRLGFTFIGLVTNGRKLRDAGFTRALLSAGLDAISVSLLGPDAQTHDALSAAPGAFDALVEGLKNATGIARELGRTIVVDANVITHAKNVDRLAEEVRVLAACGVKTGSVHLVRFDGLASDPKVVGDLAFDARRIPGALAAAIEEAKRVGMKLHATDVPICLHPRLDAEELDLAVARARVASHRFDGPGRLYFGGAHTDVTAPCASCLVRDGCPRIVTEYFTARPEETLRPITGSSIASYVDEALAAISPASREAPGTLGALEIALRKLVAIASDGAPFVREAERVKEALGDLAAVAAPKNAPIAVDAFFWHAGFTPPSWRFPPEHDFVSFARLSPADRARRTGAALDARGVAELVIGEHHVAIQGRVVGADHVEVDGLTPIVTTSSAARDRLLDAIFLVAIVPVLRAARAVRIDGDSLVVARDADPLRLPMIRPGAARLLVPS